MNAVTALPARRLGTFDQFCLSFFWFSSNAHWGAILSVLVQSQVIGMVPEERRGFGVGLAVAIGSITGIIIPPLMGAWSDRARFRMGRRRPFMLIGVLGNVVALVGLARFPFLKTGALWGFTGAYWLYVLAYVVANFANNFATAPYTALMPDVVPPEQRGEASGWYGLMSTLGSGVGIVVAGSMVNNNAPAGEYQGQIDRVYMLLAALLLVGLVLTVAGTKESPVHERPPPFSWGKFLAGLVAPFRSPDFRWVFFTRLLVTMGVFSVQNFLQLYMVDVVKDFSVFGKTLATSGEAAVMFVLGLLLLVAVPSSIIAGKLSDKYGRKLMVYIAGGIQGCVAMGLILFHQFGAALVIGVLFGLGYGSYESVNWALATDVLPDKNDAAKDMGIWHMALTVPQLIATPLAGWLLDTFQVVGKRNGQPTLGYTVIFSIAVVYFLLGTVFVRKVKSAR